MKTFVPVIAIADDRTLTSTNIPWIFRMPPETTLVEAVRTLMDAERTAGPNREKVRDALASGALLAGRFRFAATGELQ